MGAIGVNGKIQAPPGSQSSTFSGGPLACRAGLAVLDIIKEDKLVENSRIMGALLKHELNKLAEQYQVIREVRGNGLMLAVELKKKAKPVVEEMQKHKVLISLAGINGLRLLSPLTINEDDVKKFISVLEESLNIYGGE